MALKQVNIPQRRSQGALGELGQLGTAVGGVMSFFPGKVGAVGKGIAAAGSIAQTVDQGPAPLQTIPTESSVQQSHGVMDAMERRQKAMQSEQDLQDAIQAIDEIDIPNDQRQRLREPLLLAKQRREALA
jgi:hypothetical protein